ncbi:glycosyltransferase family 2 protein [Roseomonas sp. SSH11]|uniref:Glycosyltransferase family 2 protein n=1 Tax=Pararoseomonas baculiformis TaxID=2820812 RepID=A0ABS4AB75_9PROT|nr:glycosyltransferase family 2 protein [Pararoseomonas baculiformis]MBP0444261.1 glycosyltransferase family 2 protein [Pararoseomonas baculiformis]
MIVIPMAGMSRRFTEAGYDRPKYMLPLHGRSVFAHAVESFAAYFASHPFLFIARDVADTATFIAQECRTLGISEARVAILTAPTAGQAETVELGFLQAGVPDDSPVTIFNIDTFRPGFRFPDAPWWPASDGYLEVFRGSGANWSYVRPADGPEPVALETAEKRPLSDLCCTGLYHFARAHDFHEALRKEREQPSAPELYVAPLYNHLITHGGRIHYDLVAADKVIFCGVPAEYEALLAQQPAG